MSSDYSSYVPPELFNNIEAVWPENTQVYDEMSLLFQESFVKSMIDGTSKDLHLEDFKKLADALTTYHEKKNIITAEEIIIGLIFLTVKAETNELLSNGADPNNSDFQSFVHDEIRKLLGFQSEDFQSTNFYVCGIVSCFHETGFPKLNLEPHKIEFFGNSEDIQTGINWLSSHLNQSYSINHSKVTNYQAEACYYGIVSMMFGRE